MLVWGVSLRVAEKALMASFLEPSRCRDTCPGSTGLLPNEGVASSFAPRFLPISLVRPAITEEQEAFILKVTEIPLEERKCRDLITPDALHTYYGGPEPTEEARRLNNLSRQRKLPKSRAQIKTAAARKKEEGKGKEGASSSLPKVANKDAPKRKGDGTEDRPTKK
ncbi:hypothetical protein SO802_034361 [Lithocarpus litseifolius]|uniref:Uncharacterized protein n=1 Tax=Lithocarpus litseifolius TaxID=425828 RepID=A0AAW2BHV1_9ROSI